MPQKKNSSGKNSRPVWLYLALLFLVALGLILFSLAMHNRAEATQFITTLLAFLPGGSTPL